MTQPDTPASAQALPSRAQVAGRIAARLAAQDFGTGPRAELRRLDPRGALSEPALHRLLARHVPDEWLPGRGLRDWALTIHALALAAPDDRRAGERLGAALQGAGWKEGRLVNLLDATPDDLPDHLTRAVRFLVAKGKALDGRDLVALVFTAASGSERRDSVRQRIASDYYRAEMRAEGGTEAPAA